MNSVVIDCNVYISAFIGSDTCFKSIDKAFTEYRVCYSEATYKELLETLHRPKFKNILKSQRIDITLQILNSLGVFFKPAPCDIDLPDPDDRIYLDLAIAAKAAYIITGNKKHFPANICKGVQILSPGEFLQKA